MIGVSAGGATGAGVAGSDGELEGVAGEVEGVEGEGVEGEVEGVEGALPDGAGAVWARAKAGQSKSAARAPRRME